MAGQQKNQDMNQLLQVRRDKLADLQGRGKEGSLSDHKIRCDQSHYRHY